MKRKVQIVFLVLLILLLFVMNYNFLDDKIQGFLIGEREEVVVERIIDGDTIEIENKTSVRLLGVNTPERGEYYYSEAKEFLEDLILNESVELEYGTRKYDKYGRVLAYVFLDRENVNVEIVRNGFGNYYFYEGKDRYSNQLIEAWDDCLEEDKNLCERSEDVCASCLTLEEDSITNDCSFECDLNGWEVKGEGRDKVVFLEVLSPGEEMEFDSDELMENSGGSLFLRDDEGKLVGYVE